ncbi:hypothetical protein Sjap_001363 [Stephania japonica]|uniref:Nodulin-like domain-containing protein n=1 Tax=Stephania japonica TaxID=461633 RepID=A0AAP0KJT1_9MAGN
MSGAGATYVFGTYSKSIKSSLGYDQTTLNLLAFFKDLGANIGVFSGLIAEVAPTWFVLLVGSGTNFAGYFLIWLAVTGKLVDPKVWMMCLFILIGANSQNFANTAILVTCVNNFPEGRGILLGLLKGFTGLSGAVMTQIYLAIYGNDSTSLILLIGWLPTALCIVFMFTIRMIKTARQPNEIRVFYNYLYVAVILALFSMIMTVFEKQVSFLPVAYRGSASIVCILLLLPLGIAVNQELKLWRKNNELVIGSPVVVKVESLPAVTLPEFPGKFEIEEKPNGSPKRGEDHGILQAIFSFDMLLILVSTFCGLGTNLTAMDNIGQIGESLGYPTRTTSTFVSLLSIWNFCGRVFAGFVSEILIEKYRLPRPLMIASVLAMSTVGHLLIAFPFGGSVYVASVIVGFCFGAHLTLLYTIISEIFGLKHYAVLFNFGQLASPIGSYVFNVRVSGALYDREALKQLAMKGLTRESVKELTCLGTECYRLPFIITAAVAFFGACCTMVLVMRTKEFYNGDIYQKFKEENKRLHAENAMALSESGRSEANQHLIRGRWFMLFASFLIMSGAGATYVFCTYSKSIKSSLGYYQTTLNLLAFFKDLRANIGVFPGLIAEVTPTWFVLFVGAGTNFAGYFLIWLAVTGKLVDPKVWMMCLFILIGANLQNFANTGVLVTSVNNFLKGEAYCWVY